MNEIQEKYNSYIVSTLSVMNKMIQNQEQNTVQLFSYLFNQNVDINNRIDLNENNLLTKLVDLSQLNNKVDNIQKNIEIINDSITKIANSMVLMIDHIESTTSEIQNISKKQLSNNLQNNKPSLFNNIKQIINKKYKYINNCLINKKNQLLYYNLLYKTIKNEIDNIIKQKNDKIQRDLETKKRIQEILGTIR